MTAFRNKYVILMEVLYRDKELNQWCRNYSVYKENTAHCELEKLIYEGFMKEALLICTQPGMEKDIVFLFGKRRIHDEK